MNQDVIEMLEKLTLRLQDVKEVVDECPCELEGLAKRLDKIDDQLYLVMVDVEKRAEDAHKTSGGTSGASGLKSVPFNVQAQANEFDAALADESTQAKVKPQNRTESSAGKAASVSEDEDGFFSDEVKENMKEGARALNGIYKDGKEVVSELSDAMNDIKGVFNITGKFLR